jgi:glycerol-3-phosphate dehydrogenase
MIWGGLLYLKKMDLRSVVSFSRARDRMIRGESDAVAVSRLRYIPTPASPWRRAQLRAGLVLYWMLSLGRRRFPSAEKRFAEAALLARDHDRRSFCYEEAALTGSDARFVLRWIAPPRLPEQVAMNYCKLHSAWYHPRQRVWYLELHDTLGVNRSAAVARCVVNCAGVWTDKVHAELGIKTPYKHVLSKGVFVGFLRPAEHRETLILDMGKNGDVLSLIPWGPVSMWGPTETIAPTIEEGFRVGAEDAAYLMERAHAHFNGRFTKERIVSLRCGIRPLAVARGFTKDCYSLDISRRHRIWKDPDRPWIAAYGGKLTGADLLAEAIARRIECHTPPSLPAGRTPAQTDAPVEWSTFPGLAGAVPSAAWCLKHEFCCTLEDYLRRRTNISQWVPREGLGWNNENLPAILGLATTFAGGDPRAARQLTDRYEQSVRERFDSVLKPLGPS